MPAGPAGAAEALDLARLQPYLASGPGALGRAALHAGRPSEAVKQLQLQLPRALRAGQQVQARFLLAVALLQAGRHAEAAVAFAELLHSYPLLADYHRYHRARALYGQKDFASAARAASSISQRSVLHTDAELLRADALLALSRQGETVPIWERYLARHASAGKRIGEAHLRLGEAHRAAAHQAGGRADASLLRRALDHYKQVVVRAPLSRHRAAADRWLAEVAAQLPDGRELAALSVDERFIQAMVYFRAMRNSESEKGFAEVLGSEQLSAPQRCRASYHRAQSVFKARQRARAGPLFRTAAQVCRDAGDEDLVVRSRYNHARGLMAAKDYRGAAARFLELEKEHARHSYADDARLRAAEAYEALGDNKRVLDLLATLPDAYPKGDMAREALWRLARGAYLEGDLGAALGFLERTLRELGRADQYYAEGQALYWKARILDRQRKRRDAADAYEECIREYPLSYYALMAFNRLRERHRARFAKLQRELIAPVGRRSGGAWRLSLGPLARAPAFRRGLELARLGFGDDAARELHQAGLAVRRGTPTERLWLTAALFHQAGIWRLSHQVPRSLDRRYARRYPVGDELRHWRIAYPWAFPVHTAAEAARSGIPQQLVLSIMREESGFSPRVESYANAVGLMQLILPTARSAGARFGLERVDRATLHDPETNIKLGAYYLGWLSSTFSGSLPLTIAGYNAGHGAAMRWLRRYSRSTVDEFVEQIPYDQTRRYTKRVLSSYFAYSVVHGQRPVVPRLGQALPVPRKASFRASPAAGRRTGRGR